MIEILLVVEVDGVPVAVCAELSLTPTELAAQSALAVRRERRLGPGLRKARALLVATGAA